MKYWEISLFILAAIFISVRSTGQTFTASLSYDSVYLGNVLQVTFKLENGKGSDFVPPSFEGLGQVMGPSQSSMTSVVNGAVTQTLSYSYTLEPYEVGEYYIGPASIIVEGESLQTEPLLVLVLPNPEGIEQRLQSPTNSFHFDFDFFGDSPFQGFDVPELPRMLPELPAPALDSKKKRKTYRL